MLGRHVSNFFVGGAFMSGFVGCWLVLGALIHGVEGDFQEYFNYLFAVLVTSFFVGALMALLGSVINHIFENLNGF